MKEALALMLILLLLFIGSVVPLVDALSFFDRTYEGRGIGKAFSVLQTSDSGYAMAGYKIEGFTIFCLVKTDETGVIPELPSWTPLLIMLLSITMITIIFRNGIHKDNHRTE